MATRLAERTRTNEMELLKLANKRVSVPADWIEMEYRHESDVLFIRYSHNQPADTDADLRKGIVTNYDARKKLVSISVFDLYDVFASV